MGKRLTQIATRTGDDGTTGLGNNTRVSKNSLRPHAMGDVDELNSHIGLLLCEDLPADVRELLIDIQHQLFNLGGEISIPGYATIGETHILRLEQLVADFNAELPPLKEFILPGGTRAAALAHLVRSVCRRVERRVVSLGNNEPLSEYARKYLNRLSDLMFIIGRTLNRASGRGDVLWVQHKPAAKP